MHREHLRGWGERRQAITQAADKAGSNLDRDGGLTKAFEVSPFCLGDGDEPPDRRPRDRRRQLIRNPRKLTSNFSGLTINLLMKLTFRV